MTQTSQISLCMLTRPSAVCNLASKRNFRHYALNGFTKKVVLPYFASHKKEIMSHFPHKYVWCNLFGYINLALAPPPLFPWGFN